MGRLAAHPVGVGVTRQLDNVLSTIRDMAEAGAPLRLSAAGTKLLQDHLAQQDEVAARLAKDAVRLAQENQRLQQTNARMKKVEEAAWEIVYASDQCLGHRNCGHSMKPWQHMRAALTTPTEPPTEGNHGGHHA